MSTVPPPLHALPRVVLILQDFHMRIALKARLADMAEVHDFATAEEAREEMYKLTTDAVVVHEGCGPDNDGITLLTELREARPEVGTLLVVGKFAPDTISRATNLGITRVVVQPIVQGLNKALAAAMEHRRIYRARDEAEAQVADMRTQIIKLIEERDRFMEVAADRERRHAAAGLD